MVTMQYFLDQDVNMFPDTNSCERRGNEYLIVEMTPVESDIEHCLESVEDTGAEDWYE